MYYIKNYWVGYEYQKYPLPKDIEYITTLNDKNPDFELLQTYQLLNSSEFLKSLYKIKELASLKLSGLNNSQIEKITNLINNIENLKIKLDNLYNYNLNLLIFQYNYVCIICVVIKFFLYRNFYC